ncbi:putative Aldose 1-epimerase/Galactose mutarotase [Cupriavidus taiwanensis]|uniref:Aldose 1-epimerase/Galactose mutarotase n=3 Tax=Cupriavidus TaxID=106589 RepID=A0A375F5V6_9BURK|nr:putative Aldose 1-epimerase/Galactose mutarotase [Cupriavidus taiwanensis]SOZ40438.1 putative Aldose 1-epimerase/Galactose mutarotase [Cupriavidus neocaledonicus]SOY74533.1 putative Aldose 1-epimerase/Galactose mutarotase [Cupriavidus taiwanensis]SOY74537.1 putative Aldose 1-epimerase/Galactose mutarotase [Cupriavidus taiwanensis]SOY75429.1 putative Aldose 1-epimerase/Galactose mutarotase [Cupriavidus taiwanensis]
MFNEIAPAPRLLSTLSDLKEWCLIAVGYAPQGIASHVARFLKACAGSISMGAVCRRHLPYHGAFAPITTTMHLPTEDFQGHPLVWIGHADSYLLLAPQHGGRLVRWVHRGQDILYWPDAADWSCPAKVRGGNPLLFPFAGRHFVKGNPGQWRDSQGKVHSLALHGFARDLPFEVSAINGRASIRMTLRDSGATRAGYPFAFVFEAIYALLPDGLEVTLRTINTGTQCLPCYPGHHFYFALPHSQRAAASLALPRTERLRQRSDGSPMCAEPGEPTYRLDDPRLQDALHAFRANPSATLAIPGRKIRFELNQPGSAPWHAVTTWSETETADFYCVEPWVGLPDAIHHGLGLRWIEPGQKESAVCRLRVTSDLLALAKVRSDDEVAPT